MNKFKLLLVGAALLSLTGVAQAQTTRVTGKITATHGGTALACFVVAGQWYAIPTVPVVPVNGTTPIGGFPAQSTPMYLAADSGRMVEFDADTTVTFLCHGGQPAFWAHDIDETY